MYLCVSVPTMWYLLFFLFYCHNYLSLMSLHTNMYSLYINIQNLYKDTLVNNYLSLMSLHTNMYSLYISIQNLYKDTLVNNCFVCPVQCIFPVTGYVQFSVHPVLLIKYII